MQGKQQVSDAVPEDVPVLLFVRIQIMQEGRKASLRNHVTLWTEVNEDT